MTDQLVSLSVVVPTHQGAERLPRLLDSLTNQTLDPEHWEVIFILNGPDDGSFNLLESWRQRSGRNSRILSTPEAGAGIARNLGIASSRGRYLTFVDDDDWLEDRFLEVGLQNCAQDTISFLPIKDEIDGRIHPRNSLNVRRELLSGTIVPLASAAWALGFNACKFVPASIIKLWRYDERLSSGEDVVFFANLLRYPTLKIAIPRDVEKAAYVRNIRDESVSRPANGFGFNVAQRFDVIAALQAISVDTEAERARKSLESSQFKFVEEWLRGHPDDFRRAADYALGKGVSGINWGKIHADAPKRLIFSYCFPPFADPAANVVAKRIALQGDVVDVISADMSEVRDIDYSTESLVAPWVHKNTTIDGYPSFASWPHIATFGKKAARVARGEYSEIYSRALWSGSHVAGALYKLSHPKVRWEAEFSDPLRWDASGARRLGGPATGRVGRRLRRGIQSAGWESELASVINNHFALTELATLCLADELIFANENQQAVILEPYSRQFREFVLSHSSVSPQPEPPANAYAARHPKLPLAQSKVNIGYFGNFYANRGLGDFEEAVRQLPLNIASRIELHVFSSSPPEFGAGSEKAMGNVVWHSPLAYLDFLAACKQFDALIIVDVSTVGTRYALNPYLPSKYADYAGSGTPIWAMVESGSPLSKAAVDYCSELGDSRQAATNLIQIATVRE